MEEVQDWDESPVAKSAWSKAGQKPTPHYGDAAFMEDQKRFIDYIPRRLPGVGAFLFGGLILIAGFLGLHLWANAATTQYPGGTLSAFNLSAAGNLAQWFSSLLLLAAAGVSLVVYSVRRHRTDDYHGHYRVWLWAALCWFFLAADVSSGLNRGLQQVLVHYTGTTLWKDGVLWWIIPYAVVFGAIGSRLLVDMWPCRLAIAALVAATASYLAALTASLGLLPARWHVNAVMLQAGASMFGHLALLMASILQARYVLLDVEGGLPPKKAKKAKPRRIIKLKEETEEVEEESTATQWHRIDSPQSTPQPAFRRAEPAAPTFTPVSSSSTGFGTSPSPVNRKLTKQEKKALKDRLLRERMEREKKNKW
jgi:hypothetical protein